MAVLYNEKPRLLWGPKTPGHKTPQWLPGKNLLDVDYWERAKNHNTIRKWLELGFIRVALDESMPDPSIPPTKEQLEAFTPRELKAALKDPDVPIAWHSHLERELAARKTEDAEPAPSAPKPAPSAPKPSKPGLTGLTVADALPLIAAETDADKLIAWADADKRKTIGEAVDARLADLELGTDGG